ncbi:winged helix-turn-helix domain-containing protein [Roseicella aquatilis]|uniref:Response regulator transcription factor n=1 Tax=Roseicella aquatilis TaxID=2527868 RepID=A0A4R4DCH9_9PROT|nr:response regulator transcription factor [Roseicella aquatilis]TCZ57969.1 response regulator transcription factor [Roseicella aquatilis]
MADQFDEAASVLQHSGPYDAAVFELAGPDNLDAVRAALRAIRARGLSLPVIIVADLAAEEEVSLLGAGADDVLGRHARPDAIRHRLRAILRRSLGHLSAELPCGNTVVDQGRQQILIAGRPLRIGRREFQILEMLMLRPGIPISKDRFMAALYGSEDGPNERILDVFVCKLRRKLTLAGATATIRTIWGIGYALEEAMSAQQVDAEPLVAVS